MAATEMDVDVQPVDAQPAVEATVSEPTDAQFPAASCEEMPFTEEELATCFKVSLRTHAVTACD